MSDSYIDLVQLDATDDPDQARRLQQWLRDQGWAQPTATDLDAPYPTTSESELLRLTDSLGPRALELLRNEPRGEIAVTITSGWSAYTAMSNYQPPECPACGKRAVEMDLAGEHPYIELMDSWWETRIVPEHTCPLCGRKAVVTDWDLDNSAVCAYLAITADMYGAEEELLAELQREFGGKWVTMYKRI